MAGLIFKTVLVLLGCLVAADIAGVVACTIVEVILPGGNSALFPYVVWLVFGVFCGLFAYNFAGRWSSPKAEAGSGDWSARPGAAGIGNGVMITSAVVIVGLAALLYVIVWSHGGAGEYYVPDSEPHSLVFLVAVLGAMIMGRFMLMPTPDKPG
jgi:hypothetical protein